ncbi:hypothetical protein ACFL3V_01705 [Nanoarchaeota archaeon]
MGMFDFLKKDKAATPATGIELPPVPKMGGEFPEPLKEDVPSLPDSSLPPLPTEVPAEVPPKPEETKLESPKVDMLQPPEMAGLTTEPKKVEPAMPTLPEMPHIPEMPEAMAPEHPVPVEGDAPKLLELPPDIDQPEMSKLPDLEMPEEKMEAPPEQAKPEFPEVPHDAMIPDSIPPLEGLPEAPEFTPEPEPMPIIKDEPADTIIEEHAEAPPAVFVAPEHEPLLRRRHEGPLFIKTDTVKAIMDDIEQVKAKFKEEDDIFFRITDVKGAQDQHYEDFRQTLEDMQRKLLFIDRSLFER